MAAGGRTVDPRGGGAVSVLPIRAVFFDAVGTVLHPEPAAVEVYADVGHRHGSQLDAADIRAGFRTAFLRQEMVDRHNDWRTSAQRELERWRSIVFEVLHDAVDREACFRELYEHFARPASWRCDGTPDRLFAALASRGFMVAMASNFDERLRRVLAGWGEGGALRHVVISAEVGWRKPSPRFFEAMCQAVDLMPPEILYVGDDRVNDFEGALAAGCRAVLFDPAGQMREVAPRIAALSELLEGLQM
jgi:putative hydrolase of the HAD superfamily